MYFPAVCESALERYRGPYDVYVQSPYVYTNYPVADRKAPDRPYDIPRVWSRAADVGGGVETDAFVQDSLRLFLLKICSEHVTVFSPLFFRLRKKRIKLLREKRLC